MATAIVVAGAGARGAYEAGMLSVIVPRLYAEGERELVLLGTSAGAINVAILAATANAPEQSAERLCDVWTRLERRDVFDLRVLNVFLGGMDVLVRGKAKAHPYSLLDTSALDVTIESNKHVNWETLRANVGRTWVKAAGVVATHVGSGRSFVFTQGLSQLPPADKARGIEYVGVKLDGKYVRASAAIPVAFPSVQIRVDGMDADVAWFSDGGTRLNTPIKPASDILKQLGCPAKRFVIVGTHPDPAKDASSVNPPSGGEPDIIDEAASVLHSIFIDRVAEDVRRLRKTNDILGSSGAGANAQPTTRYEILPHAYFGPPENGMIAKAAKEIFEEFGHLAVNDFTLISRFLGGESASRNELLSYLFFDSRFLSRIFEEGRQEGERLTRNGIVWQTTGEESRKALGADGGLAAQRPTALS